MNNDNEDPNNTFRHNVITLMDNFIEQILQKTKNTLSLALALSVSAIALAPLAIGLSIFLLLHPSFFLVLEKESEFGLFLSIVLVGIVIVSLIWLVIGIKQYRSIKLWNKRYSLFIKRKEEIDKNVAAEYDLDLDQDY